MIFRYLTIGGNFKIVMKLLGEYPSDGKIVVIPQDSDDLYHLYNIIAPGDKIRSVTTRKIKGTDQDYSSTSRITVNIELEVEGTEFHGFGESIRVRGQITEASDPSVSLGSYHSINIELYKKLSIIKPQGWSNQDVKRIREAQMGKPSNLIVVAIDDQSAIISQVGTHASKILLEMEPSIPRKGSDPQQHRKETREFFSELAEFLQQQKEQGTAKHFIIGGPGFTKENLSDYLKINHPELINNLKFVHTKSAGRGGIKEIITEHISDNLNAGLQAQRQAQLIEEILEAIGKDTGLIAYGSDVVKAAEMGAIEKLLVLDTELRDTLEKRGKIQKIMEKVENMGGETILMSSMHDSSEILEGLGKIVALLRFKLPK